MSVSDYVRLCRATERKIEQLEEKITSLDARKRDIKRQIDQLRCGLCPIVPGDIIYWDAGTRVKRGKVISVRADYRDQYEFRVHLIDKSGQAVGYATVHSKQMPTKEPPK